MAGINQGERIRAVEVEIQALKIQVESMDKKLDELLALKNKGAGIFWLSSILFGSSLAAAITYFMSWLKG